MKYFNLNNGLAIGLLALAAACQPFEPSHTELGDPPTASFTWTYGVDSIGAPDSNRIELTSTATGSPFIYQWNSENGASAEGATASMVIAQEGTYTLTHTVFNQGGHDVDSTEVMIPYDLPQSGCDGAYKILTGCGSRTWSFRQVDSALWVGPVDRSSNWWYIGQFASAPDYGRPCFFNNTWTFNTDGDMVFETNGNVWGEGYVSPDPAACIPDSTLPAATAAWGPGTHTFEFIPGVNPGDRDQLKVSGLGAHIGLPKCANGAEVTAPQSQVIYDIYYAGQVNGEYLLGLEVNVGVALGRYTLIAQ